MPSAPQRPLPQLPNSPLVEAIFELRWQLPSVDGQARPTQDSGFGLLLGRFQERMQDDYPVARSLPAAAMPDDMTPYMVRNQFRASEDGWPLTQLGPGVLTVNETAGYSWDTFEPRVMRAFAAVSAAYPKLPKMLPFQPTRTVLRYQNAVCIDRTSTSPRQFLREKLNTNVQLADGLFAGQFAATEATDLRISFVCPLRDHPAEATFQIGTGTKQGEPAVIFELIVQARDASAPSDESSLGSWLATAHSAIEEWFVVLCGGPLFQEFAQPR